MTQLQPKMPVELAAPTSRRRPPVDRRAVRILLVDDDPIVRSALKRLLSTHFQVETAENADEAEQLLRCRRFSAIISDFDMPGHDGIWLLAQAATKYPSTRRVILSGRAAAQFTAHVDSGVVQLCLEKPASPMRLMDFLR